MERIGSRTHMHTRTHTINIKRTKEVLAAEHDGNDAKQNSQCSLRYDAMQYRPHTTIHVFTHTKAVKPQKWWFPKKNIRTYWKYKGMNENKNEMNSQQQQQQRQSKYLYLIVLKSDKTMPILSKSLSHTYFEQGETKEMHRNCVVVLFNYMHSLQWMMNEKKKYGWIYSSRIRDHFVYIKR